MIATSIEQSRKLIGLGLETDSADMTYLLFSDGKHNLKVEIGERPEGESFLPAWSLSALLEVMPPFIKGHHLKIEKTRITNMWYLDYQYLTDSEPRKDLLTAAYEMACWLLDQGLIKKGGQDE